MILLVNPRATKPRNRRLSARDRGPALTSCGPGITVRAMARTGSPLSARPAT